MCKKEGSASVEKVGVEQGMEGVDCVEEGRREGAYGGCGDGEEGGERVWRGGGR